MSLKRVAAVDCPCITMSHSLRLLMKKNEGSLVVKWQILAKVKWRTWFRYHAIDNKSDIYTLQMACKPVQNPQNP